MKLAHTKTACWIGVSLILCAIIACNVVVEQDEEGIKISNEVFSLTLGNNGVFNLTIAGVPVVQMVGVSDLYSAQTPKDVPASAVVALSSNSVAVEPLGALKAQPASQEVSGSADLAVYIGDSATTDPCTNGVYIGSFHITFGASGILIDRVSLAVPPQALAWLVSGSFTMCLEMTGDVTVRISIQGLDIQFGPPADVTCTLASGCPSGQTCVNGMCVTAVTAECVFNVDCASGEVCLNDECVSETTPECVTDSDCAAGEACVNGECVPRTTAECLLDSDCASGHVCLNGECVAGTTPECVLNSGCASGEVCLNGECVAETPSGCVSDSDCASGETCVDGECVAGTTPECALNSDCASGEVCLNGECVAEETPECVDDTDCADGETCVGGECVPGLTSYPATIEYVETITTIVTADDFGDWPADAYRGLGGPAVSADGSRLAFGAYGGWDNQEDTRFYVVDTDGSNLTNVTGTFPDENANRYGFGSLRLNDSGDRLFGKDALSIYTTVIYYYDLPSGNWARAVDQGLGDIEGWKPFMINGEGTRLFFKHTGEYDAEAGFTPRGLYYADLGGSPVQFLELADLPDPGAVTWMNVLHSLGCSADGSVVTFTWAENTPTDEDTGMWMAGPGTAASKIPDETHTYLFTSQDLPHKLVSADGSLALYGHYDSGEPRQLELIDLGTGGRTPLAADSGVGDFTNSCLSGNGNFVLYDPSGGYLARIDLETGEARDVMSYHTINYNWSPHVSDLTYDGRYLYFAADIGTYGGNDTIYRVDTEPGTGSYDQAPSISEIAFSAASLPNDASTTITLAASISDPQGPNNIASVNWISLVDGLEGATWMSSSPLTGWGGMDDDGEDGDEVAGDGIYTSSTLKTASDTNVFDSEYKGLPYDVGVRIVVEDTDGNYTFADTTLTVVGP